MITSIDLCKQQKPDADPKEILQINFTGNLHQARNIGLFIIEEPKQNYFTQGTVTIF